MSVIKSKRTEATLSVVTKAEELVVYTMRIACNEKRMPKRYRWCITAKIVNEAQEMLRKLTFANSIKVESAADWQRRRVMQSEAMAHTFCLLTEINLAYKVFCIPANTVQFWTGQIMEVQRLLKAWQKSDTARYGALC